ncbi:MAG: hypothetical protein RIQ52_1006 [Pseudomonadota bacterium]|jgi:uncharacterized protein YqeY
MSTTKQRLQDDVKSAMKSGDKARLGTLRLVMAAIKQREVDERIELDEEQVILVLDKMVKQRRESIAQYEAAQRSDLVAVEESEIVVLRDYLPVPMEDQEIDALLRATIDATGASGMAGMGKVMNVIRPQLTGRADMSQVSAKLKTLLQGS